MNALKFTFMIATVGTCNRNSIESKADKLKGYVHESNADAIKNTILLFRLPTLQVPILGAQKMVTQHS